MYKLIKNLLRPVRKPTAASAADHWSRWQSQVDADKPRWVDWGEHPTFLELMYRQHFGSKDLTLFHYLKNKYGFFGHCKALSLCSGDGTFENLLASNGIFAHITGIDVSEYRVAKATRDHAGANSKLEFVVGDINAGNYGTDAFDVVFAKAALHHIEALEAAFRGMHDCLKDTGYLVTIDFFGPTRFQWTDAQLQQANRLLQEIPETLRTDKNGTVKTTIRRPSVEEMIEADPSEAVRSAEVYGFIEKGFTILDEFDIGGTVFNLIFTSDIIDNFDPGEESHRMLVKRIYDEERRLLDAGVLPSDFKLIIAERRR